MKNDREYIVLQTMMDEGIIPETSTFEVKTDQVDAFFSIYRKLFSKTDKKLSASNTRYAKKLAGLSLMKLNLSRFEEVAFSEVRLRVKKPKCGIVYLVSNPAFPGYFKVGMTRDLMKRLASYQTGDPHRAYIIEHYKFVEDARAEERRILEEMNIDLAKGEWVSSDRVKGLFVACPEW